MKLAVYLSKNGISHSMFAETIGTSQATVSRYALSRRIPRAEHMVKIAEATHGQVTPNDFLLPEMEADLAEAS